MAIKLVIDGCFVRSLGSIKVASNIIEALRSKFTQIELVILRRDENLFKSEINHDFITLTKVSNYFEGFKKFLFFKNKTSIITINNLPSISPFAHQRVLLLHNIFYVYSIKELFDKRNLVPKFFIFKYIYFHIFARVIPPSKILVQTNFMKKRVKQMLGQDSYVIETFQHNPLSVIEFDHQFRYDILVIGGNGAHKNVLNTVGCLNESINLMEKKIGNVMRIGVVGSEEIGVNFSSQSQSKFDFLGTISSSEILETIKSSKVCLIPSLAESYCFPVIEVADMKRPLVVVNEEYSRELLKTAYFYSGDNVDLIAVLLTALKNGELCVLNERYSVGLYDLVGLLNEN